MLYRGRESMVVMQMLEKSKHSQIHFPFYAALAPRGVSLK